MITETLAARIGRRRPAHVDEIEVIETMRQLRVCIRSVLDGRTIEQSAGLAAVSTNTLTRILRGENVTISTAARIIGRLGGQLVVRVEHRNAIGSHS